jgi:hypothetical protein
VVDVVVVEEGVGSLEEASEEADEAVEHWLRKLRDEAYIEDRLAKAAEQD